MAFTSTDDFDSYTLGANLDTLNGGANWSGAWADIDGDIMTVETAPSGGQGGKAVRSNAAVANTKYRRSFTDTSSGLVGLRMRISITNPNDFVGIELGETIPSANFFVRFGPTGNIEIFNNDTASYETVQAYSADTWYLIEIDWNDSTNPDKYRVRVDGRTYSAFKGALGAYSNMGFLQLDDSATNVHTFWVDDIGAFTTPTDITVDLKQFPKFSMQPPRLITEGRLL